MFNNNHDGKQAELFDNLAGADKKPKKHRFNLAKIALSLSYESIIIITIGLIMLFIVCYSLGVEKGKLLVQLNTEGPVDTQMQQKQAEKEIIESTPQPQEKKVKVRVAEEKEHAKSFPYIQVASFYTDKYAERAITSLKDSGYQPFLARWGKFRVVCVGGYENKAEAVKALTQLEKDYGDCILRTK